MSNLLRNGLILALCLAVSAWAIFPFEKKLRRGKDLAGGVSLTYGVDVKETDPPDTMAKVKTVISERLDPNGVLEIGVIPTGRDRIEITMPLPSDAVRKLKDGFEAKLGKVQTTTLTRDELERIAVQDEATRKREIERLGGQDATRRARIEQAMSDFAVLGNARAAFRTSESQIRVLEEKNKASGTDNATDPILTGLRDKARELVTAAALADATYESSVAKALSIGLNPGDLRRALQLSDRPFRIAGKQGKVAELDSPRKRTISELKVRFPEQVAAIDDAIVAWDAYEKERSSLDDPQDIVRMLRGSGVLNFRITVNPGEYPSIDELRNQLRAGGPRSVKSEDVRWFKVNKIEQWVQSVDDLEALKQSPIAFFGTRGYVAGEYKGEFYLLCWDRRGQRLTQDDGTWAVSNAMVGSDQIGRPAIDFQMDNFGADKLGRLTEANVGRSMAVLLDDEVYTAPRLNSRIADRGQISGTFSPAELAYIVRVLGAGSLQAKLTPEPISQSTMGPSLGKENLDKGLTAGIVAFVVVAGFMIAYYFGCGLISIIALVLNAIMLVAAMALNQAAFTLPGIAGVILTFGMAVDANVLVYERMREEFRNGHDLRTAVRLGYSKALAAIVDGNITTLIVCVVLGFFGTQEIKGFALTLGIGSVTSLFAQLFGSRFLFTVLIERMGVRKMTMLPMAMGWTLRPHIDWLGMRFFSYGISILLAGMGVFFLIYKGSELLGTEFRGGTSVTLQLKETSPGTRLVLPRGEVEDIVHAVGRGLPANDPLSNFSTAEVIAVNPDDTGKQSSTFAIKTLVTDPNLVQKTLIEQFGDKLDVRQSLKFNGSEMPGERAPIYAIISPILGDVIDRPDVRTNISEFEGGAAIVMDKIEPSISKAELESRLASQRTKADNADVASRNRALIVLAGSDNAVTSAVILAKDADVLYAGDARRWGNEVRDREWAIAKSALTQSQTLAEVQSFSPSVAQTFRAQAIIALLLSTLLVVMYLWVRFNSFRYSLAAIATTLHDCMVAIGFVALATVLFQWNPDLAGKLGIMPFKIDLNVVAAVLTILGYSLNDTVIVMDRIRENRGKLPYASKRVINDSINQTISRTIITAGTTFLACMVLYVAGGEGVRVFAYTMLIGILVGTYSSIAVAAPLVWVQAADRMEKDKAMAASSGIAPQAG